MDRDQQAFPPLLISSDDLARTGVALDPRVLHATAARMWADMSEGLTTGKKSVLLPSEPDLWASANYAPFRHRLGDERLGWKLSALSAIGPRLAGVKIVGANATNRFFGIKRSFSTILLLDKFSMRPVCLLEGTDISAARTATYASLVGEVLLRKRDQLNVFLFGGGPIAQSIVLALDGVLGARITRLWVKTRSLESAQALASSLPPMGSVIEPVADTSKLCQANLIITASNAKHPVFASMDVSSDTVVLHLGGDETPVEFVSRTIEEGTLVCDDPAMVSQRNSQSLALYFSRRDLHLEDHAKALSVLGFSEYVAGKATDIGPTLITCVGLPSLDLYIAEHVYQAYSAAAGHPAPRGSLLA
jgi:ornithine cyclodeaminase/alanine dehydrogenase-like protein (mu-crystallin family)